MLLRDKEINIYICLNWQLQLYNIFTETNSKLPAWILSLNAAFFSRNTKCLLNLISELKQKCSYLFKVTLELEQLKPFKVHLQNIYFVRFIFTCFVFYKTPQVSHAKDLRQRPQVLRHCRQILSRSGNDFQSTGPYVRQIHLAVEILNSLPN